MLLKRTVAVALALALSANAALAGGIRMYKADETPDPNEVASVLARSGLKMRSIRMLPGAGIPEAKAAEPASAAATPDVPGTAERHEPQTAAAPAAAKEAPAAAATASARPAAKADELPSEFALPVQFAFDSAQILPAAHHQLDAVAKGIRLAGPGVKIVIEGHTDAQGSSEYNLKLSAQRAEAVRTYLITRHGLDPLQLRVVGMGKLAPLDKAAPYAPENRRVQFHAEA